MDSFLKFINKPFSVQILFFKSLFYIALIKILLKALNFNIFKKTYRKLFLLLKSSYLPNDNYITNVIWAVVRTKYFIPSAKNCLVQALASKLLLARYGKAIKLHIGVKFDPSHKFLAHAWVEYNSEIIIGELPGEHYQNLWVWEN